MTEFRSTASSTVVGQQISTIWCVRFLTPEEKRQIHDYDGDRALPWIGLFASDDIRPVCVSDDARELLKALAAEGCQLLCSDPY